jgi:hypothetical protein
VARTERFPHAAHGWLPPAAVGRRLLRFEARSAAAWVGLVAAFGCGWLLVRLATAEAGLAAAGLRLAVPVAIATGGLLASVASGDFPRRLAEREGWMAAVRLVRLAWPLAGCLLGIAAGFGASSGPGLAAAPLRQPAAGSIAVATLMLPASILATGGAIAAATALAGPVAAVGIGLMLAGAAAATALLAAMAISAAALPQAMAALAAWLLLAAGWWTTGQDRAEAQGSLGAAWSGWPAGLSAIPASLVATALATSLVAMAGCYFLAPQTAWLYATLACSWLLVLAVPPATAAAGGLAGGRVVRSAAGRGPLPGSLWRAGLLMASAVAFLGWPAVVAILVPSSAGPRVGGPLVALGCLAAAAGMILAALAAAGRRGRLARAVIYAAAALAAAGIAHSSRC